MRFTALVPLADADDLDDGEVVARRVHHRPLTLLSPLRLAAAAVANPQALLEA
jgi:hypothetical protein